MFRAWDIESRLILRLDTINCEKGELVRKKHILLQGTGLKDRHHEDLYEMDLVLMGSEKFVVRWSEERAGWSYLSPDGGLPQALSAEAAGTMVRLCSYFESSTS